MRLGRELRLLRRKLRLTLVKVSDKTGLSVSFLSDLERGRTRPSLETLEKLAACYEVSLNNILKETELEVAISEKSYPPGFEDFLQVIGGSVDDEMEDLLLRTENRSKRRAHSTEDWLKMYYSLKALLGE